MLSWLREWLYLPLKNYSSVSTYAWAGVYIVLALFFWFASSPFVSTRQRRTKWTWYAVIYNLTLFWMIAGLTGHLPLFREYMIDFDIDEPAGLFSPLFWTSLLALLSVDLIHYRTQRFLYRQAKKRRQWAHMLYKMIRTKFHITFARSLSEALLSSFAVAALCSVLHTRLIREANQAWQWNAYVLIPRDYPTRISDYYKALPGSPNAPPITAEVTGLWWSFMSVIVVHFWMERVSEVRGIFEDNPSYQERVAANDQAADNDGHEKMRRLSLSRHQSGGTSVPGARWNDGPQDKMPMAVWYDHYLFSTAIDMCIHLSLFQGRFDMRQLLAAKTGDDNDTSTDPFFFDHSCDDNGNPKEELWFDFMADCGDGFDSSYAVAWLLAQPSLELKNDSQNVDLTNGNGNGNGNNNDDKDHNGTNQNEKEAKSGEQNKDNKDNKDKTLTLPRGEVLLLGGDLAYPRPTPENFEKRFLRVFQDALPSPSNAPKFNEDHISLETPTTKEHKGPVAYAVPGNHDWFDGLNCFVRYIIHRDWLGGWLLPQKKSYFALRLPHNWYVFGLDNGLTEDIDPQQTEYFAKVAQKLPDNAKVVIITHDPNWVMNQHHQNNSNDTTDKHRTGRHLEFLMNGALRGKVRLRLAGDLHNYMRHTSERVNQLDGIEGGDHGGYIHEGTNGPTLVVAGGGGAFLHPTHCLGQDTLVNVAGTQGQNYTRKAAYPDSAVSSSLSWQNLTKFRKRNWRFDAIGGLVYFALAHSFFGDCTVINNHTLDSVRNADLWTLLASFIWDSFTLVPHMISSSTVSFLVAIGFWFVAVNAVDSNKLGIKFGFGTLHALCHFLCATGVHVAIEWSFLVWTAHGTLGQGGIEVQWTKFQSRFPEGVELIEKLGNWTFGVVPALIKSSMLVADSPQTQVKVHQAICAAQGGELASDNYTMFYWCLRAAWYWVLACPIVASVMAFYFYFSLNYVGIHWNEGFSSLQHTGFKNFLRMKINKQGNLELYAIGLDKAPVDWVADPIHEQEEYSAVQLAGLTGEDTKSYEWLYPSRWMGKKEGRNLGHRVVDFTVVE